MFTHPISGASYAPHVSVIRKEGEDDGTPLHPGDMVTSTTTGHTYTVVSLNGGNRFTMKLGESEFECIILGKGVHDCPPSFFCNDSDGSDMSQGTSHLWKIHIGFRTGKLQFFWTLTPKFWPRGVKDRPVLRSMVKIKSFKRWKEVPGPVSPVVSPAVSPVVAPVPASPMGPASNAAAPACPVAASGAVVSSAAAPAVPAPAALTLSLVNELDQGKLYYKINPGTDLRKVLMDYQKRTGRFGLCLLIDGKLVTGGTSQHPTPLDPSEAPVAPILDGDTVHIIAPDCSSMSWDKKFVNIKVDGEEYLMRSDRPFGKLFDLHVKKTWSADQIGKVGVFMRMRGKPTLEVKKSKTPADLGAKTVYMFTKLVEDPMCSSSASKRKGEPVEGPEKKKKKKQIRIVQVECGNRVLTFHISNNTPLAKMKEKLISKHSCKDVNIYRKKTSLSSLDCVVDGDKLTAALVFEKKK